MLTTQSTAELQHREDIVHKKTAKTAHREPTRVQAERDATKRNYNCQLQLQNHCLDCLGQPPPPQESQKSVIELLAKMRWHIQAINYI